MKVMTADQLAAVLASVTYSTPPLPRTLAETGVAPGELLNLLLKFMYLESRKALSDLGDALRLPFQVVRELVDQAVRRQLVEGLGTSTPGNYADIHYKLSDKGRASAIEALEQNLYLGPAPVPLATFQEQIQKQRLANEFIDAERLRQGLGGLLVSEHYIRKLLPAINAGQSLLLFGPPGNGKTTVAARFASLFQQVIYVPYAVEIAGHLMKVFDQSVHQPVVAEVDRAGLQDQGVGGEAFDDRWVACRRPFALAGGELTLEMLDLQYDGELKYYDAPLHVKALNGVFLIDDFGRQRVDPKSLLDRWILPMENRVDYLKLRSGKSFSLPFDEFVIFSTNIEPQEIMEAALLRRIPYKIKIFGPDHDEYKHIFHAQAKAFSLQLDDEVIEHVIDMLSVRGHFGLAFYQPKFICEQVAQICRSFAIKPVLTNELATEALANLYVEIESAKNPALGR